MERRRPLAIALPLLLTFAGFAWMRIALGHFEGQTGRAFYGLAANYDSASTMPHYQPGGERIERWAVTIPTKTVLALLASSLVGLTVVFRRKSWFLAFLWILHIVMILAFLLVAGWCDLNVTGVFIFV